MKKCLVVDDVEVTRYTSEQFISALGLTAVAASNSDEALQALAKSGFDVVLLDWHLRKDSGLDLISKIKSSAPSAKVVVFSGVEGAEKRGEAMQSGAHAFIEKPTTKAKLETCFKELGII